MRYEKAYRMARRAARPPLWTYFLKGMSLPLALADLSLMYELSNIAFDSEGLVGILLAVSVTVATIALPMVAAKLLRTYLGNGEDVDVGDRATLILSVVSILGFVALAGGVFWFRIRFEGQNDALTAAASGARFPGTFKGESISDGALTKSVLLLIIMTATGVVSFANSYVEVSGPQEAVRELAVLRERRLQWEVEGELAAEMVMREERTLMEEERMAIDAVTDAMLIFEAHLLDLRNVVDPAQAQLVETMLRKLTANKEFSQTVAPAPIEGIDVGELAQNRAA